MLSKYQGEEEKELSGVEIYYMTMTYPHIDISM
jgi:hypothetical protein